MDVGPSFNVDQAGMKSVSDIISTQNVYALTAPNRFKHLFPSYTTLEPKNIAGGVILAVVLLPGIDCGAFSFRDVDGGNFIELIEKWSVPLIDLQLLHKKCLN